MAGVKKIPGFTPHGTRYRAHVLLDEADALAVAAEAERRRTTAGALMRERVVGGEAARMEGGRVVLDLAAGDGRRVVVLEWAVGPKENG